MGVENLHPRVTFGSWAAEEFGEQRCRRRVHFRLALECSVENVLHVFIGDSTIGGQNWEGLVLEAMLDGFLPT